MSYCGEINSELIELSIHCIVFSFCIFLDLKLNANKNTNNNVAKITSKTVLSGN